MREIKFRSFNDDSREFEYFDLDTYDSNYHDTYGNLEQYTGLKDKNGKEDYEGNLWAVEFNGEKHIFERIVEKDWNGYSFNWECLTGEISPVHAAVDENGEIIGNIHEATNG